VDRNDWRRSVHRPQSSSASRRTAVVAGSFDLIQSSELSDRSREPIRFETIPSSPILQAWRKPIAWLSQMLVQPYPDLPGSPFASTAASMSASFVMRSLRSPGSREAS
jgi:hypothetical protein